MEEPEVRDAGDRAHHLHDLIALRLKRLQVGAIQLHRQLTLHAAHRLFDVVRDGLREVPDHAGHLLQLTVHCADEFILVLVKDGTPLVLGLEVDEVLGIEEAGGVGAVVRAANLADDLGDLWEARQHDSGLVGDGEALGGAGAGGQGTAHPDGAFIEVGQELRSDHAAEGQEAAKSQHSAGNGKRHNLVVDCPCGACAIAVGKPAHHWVLPLAGAVREHEARQNRREEHREDE